jgi:hypothetical protein
VSEQEKCSRCGSGDLVHILPNKSQSEGFLCRHCHHAWERTDETACLRRQLSQAQEQLAVANKRAETAVQKISESLGIEWIHGDFSAIVVLLCGEVKLLRDQAEKAEAENVRLREIVDEVRDIITEYAPGHTVIVAKIETALAAKENQ